MRIGAIHVAFGELGAAEPVAQRGDAEAARREVRAFAAVGEYDPRDVAQRHVRAQDARCLFDDEAVLRSVAYFDFGQPRVRRSFLCVQRTRAKSGGNSDEERFQYIA